jgi:murein DD-endopeptidase MepM/ murein hydrolase activator NlpD
MGAVPEAGSVPKRLLAILVLVLAVPSVALADGTNGGVGPGTAPPPPAPVNNGGTAPGSVSAPATPPKPAPPPKRTKRRGPGLEYFSVGPASTFIYGRPAEVRFKIRSRRPAIRLHLVISPVGSSTVVRSIDLGMRRTRVMQSYSLTGLEGGVLPQGSFYVRLSAHGLHAVAKASRFEQLSFHWHQFPLVGQFTYGIDADGRFGAPRPGHSHQGQDISAPLGTPVVAPRGGLIKHVGYQKGGAGYYVVLHGEGGTFDYVFDHLGKGTILVSSGQTVATGQQLAQVGATGDATGPHLHFEIWNGPWFEGGQPIDPLPYLRRWDEWS